MVSCEARIGHDTREDISVVWIETIQRSVCDGETAKFDVHAHVVG